MFTPLIRGPVPGIKGRTSFIGTSIAADIRIRQIAAVMTIMMAITIVV
jgi:hypothetical protein